ncbi:MAG: hypothetical protein PHR24_02420 [Oscillospiraceae bacterium]|nr:hypothetical protein [Oscillospiraceae bacterium]
MSLLFSQVRIIAGDESDEFLIGGIPREYDDLEDWSAFEDFMMYVHNETEVLVHAEAYLYGEGETENASPYDIAYLISRMDNDEQFLNRSTVDNIESVDFSFVWSPEELFGDDPEDDECIEM